jgi:hypothetical protein
VRQKAWQSWLFFVAVVFSRNGGSVARAWLAAGACLVGACSRTDEVRTGRELIPAEWTVAEDTSATGEVTTVSLQLPSAREIGGLLDEDAPRLILRCLDGKIQAFIDTESAPRSGDELSVHNELVPVALDSTPSCE